MDPWSALAVGFPLAFFLSGRYTGVVVDGWWLTALSSHLYLLTLCFREVKHLWFLTWRPPADFWIRSFLFAPQSWILNADRNMFVAFYPQSLSVQLIRNRKREEWEGIQSWWERCTDDWDSIISVESGMGWKGNSSGVKDEREEEYKRWSLSDQSLTALSLSPQRVLSESVLLCETRETELTNHLDQRVERER